MRVTFDLLRAKCKGRDQCGIQILQWKAQENSTSLISNPRPNLLVPWGMASEFWCSKIF